MTELKLQGRLDIGDAIVGTLGEQSVIIALVPQGTQKSIKAFISHTRLFVKSSVHQFPDFQKLKNHGDYIEPPVKDEA